MYYYVGLNESSIGNTQIFNGSITIKGSNTNNNYAYNKIYGKELDYNNINNIDLISKFYSEYMNKIISKDKNAKFIFYSLVDITKFDTNLIKHIICNNSQDIISILNDKIKTRELLKNEITTLKYYYLQGKDISFNKLKSLLPNYSQYVIQQPFGFAGFGTYLVNKNNSEKIINNLDPTTIYSISGYEENSIPLNNTFFISKNKIITPPGSIQIITTSSQLNYDGFNFEQYENINDNLKNRINTQTLKICKKLQSLGYCGIGGIDYIIKDNNIYFMEINPRFQASSTRLNDILLANGFDDIYSLTINAFYNENKLPNITHI